jgi:thymidylate synthase ThyX
VKRILGSGYIKKISSNGTDNILIETIRDLHPDYRDVKFPIQRILDDGPIDAFEHYNFTFKLKVPHSLLYVFRYYRTAILTELPEIELDAYIPPVFLKGDQKMLDKENSEVHTKYKNFYTNLFNFFNKLRAESMATHQLEYILPGARWGEFYYTINLNDLMLFLNVNLSSEMPEMVEISQAMLEYFKEVFPLLAAIFLRRKFSA